MNWRPLTLGGCIWLRNVHRLHTGHNLLSLNFTIRLDDWQSKWSRPHETLGLSWCNSLASECLVLGYGLGRGYGDGFRGTRLTLVDKEDGIPDRRVLGKRDDIHPEGTVRLIS